MVPPPSCVIRGESCSRGVGGGLLRHSDNTGTRKQETCSFFLPLHSRTAHQTVQLVVPQVQFFKSVQERKRPADGRGGEVGGTLSAGPQPQLRRNSYRARSQTLTPAGTSADFLSVRATPSWKGCNEGEGNNELLQPGKMR